MTPALWKDLFREIRHSLGRYLSILAITALGVSFFAGIKASAPDMKNSADVYFDRYNLQDIQVYSTVGLSDKDLEALKKEPGVKDAQGQFSADYLCRKGSREMTVKVLSYTDGQTINTPRLVEGRLPQNDRECMVEGDSATGNIFGSFEIGDTVHLYSGNDTPVSDDLKYDTYTITGKAYSPNYLSYVHGSSSIGSGTVDTYFFIPQSAIKADYFTEIDLTVDGAKEADTYSDAYFDLTDPVVDEVETLADSRTVLWKDEQRQKIDDQEKEAQDKLADAKKKLDDAKKKLEDAALQIADGEKQISDNEALLASSKTQLDQGRSALQSGKQQIADGLAQIDAGLAQLQGIDTTASDLIARRDALTQAIQGVQSIDQAISGIESLDQGIQTLSQQIAALESADPQNTQLPALKEQLAALQAQLQGILAQAVPGAPDAASALAALNTQKSSILASIGGSLDAANASLTALNDRIAQAQSAIVQRDTLVKQRQELAAQQNELAASETQLAANQKTYDDGVAQLNQAKNDLAKARSDYASGQKEYEDGLAEYNTNKKEAEDKIADAKKQLDDLEAKWIVLDRNSHYSYKDYEACADRMDGIASVFPVFFFLVAALVCMTTMTRMVDEQRNEMGTLKALGYSRRQIAAKYLLYAGSASVLGSILGCAVGMYVFPMIIYSAWNIMYNLEAIQFRFQPGLMLFASLSVTGVVLLAALFSIIKELREVPAQLMRPKAAKAGKRILLERVGWFWSKLSFMHKVTLRNLFRYKKRFFMTVIGIAGCSALLVAGFGLNDSISDIVPRQFQAIYHFDAAVDAKEEDGRQLAADLKKEKGIEDTFNLETLPVTVHYDDKDVSATLNIVEDPEAFEEFMTFIPMDGSERLSLNDDGVLVSVKTAEKMHLSKGDTIRFKTADDEEVDLPIAGIFEQYTGHMLYVTQKTFDRLHIQEEPDAQILLLNDDTSPEFESELGSCVLQHEGVRSDTFYSATIDNFENMISSIKSIVVVLVLSAAMLAFVVLYNLSNVNISERLREIATIKVLGFTEKEVNAYINRESIILALIGGLVGLLLGIYLHDLIMNLAELDTIRFGRTIFWQSYVYSIGLTMLFALLVNWIMKYRLRKIQMVESLKAVE